MVGSGQNVAQGYNRRIPVFANFTGDKKQNVQISDYVL